MAEAGPDLLERQQPHERLLPAPEREVELRQRPRPRRGGQRETAVDCELEHLVGQPPALGLVAAQAREPGEAGERQRAGVLRADVLGQPRRLVRVGGRLGQPPVPQREVGAQAEDVRQERDRGALARHRDGAVERAQRAGAIADEDAAGRRPQHLARVVERLGTGQRLVEARRSALRVTPQQPAEPGLEQARHRLPFAPRVRLEACSDLGRLEHALRVAAHRGGLEREAEQVEGGPAIERGDGLSRRHDRGVRRARDGRRRSPARRGCARPARG